MKQVHLKTDNNNNNTIITIKKPGWYLERWLVIIESEI